MALYGNNANTTGSARPDLIVPFDGTGNASTVDGGAGDDTILGNRLACWSTYGNSNQTYTTAYSIENSGFWTVGG